MQGPGPCHANRQISASATEARKVLVQPVEAFDVLVLHLDVLQKVVATIVMPTQRPIGAARGLMPRGALALEAAFHKTSAVEPTYHAVAKEVWYGEFAPKAVIDFVSVLGLVPLIKGLLVLALSLLLLDGGLDRASAGRTNPKVSADAAHLIRDGLQATRTHALVLLAILIVALERVHDPRSLAMAALTGELGVLELLTSAIMSAATQALGNCWQEQQQRQQLPPPQQPEKGCKGDHGRPRR
eukprot:CAMPEP_0179102364 /NCGR_PEP_ID=MMETSP0796-20121207/47375_1 /TAXON_ID=73915 /ORGANISM="Pyrodinium bahamense, Strain pbaha01" /LENGTH=241 /DNA_ID=CAMNT_0020800239 /DNA_START=49 /DNA_END=771 /DNA_ORIENTATION=+